jgi:hypothetical protein
VDALAGKPLLIPRPRQLTVDVVYISWHHQQVFKGHHAEADAATQDRESSPMADGRSGIQNLTGVK